MKPSDPSGGVLGTAGYARARVDFGCLLLPADESQEVMGTGGWCFTLPSRAVSRSDVVA